MQKFLYKQEINKTLRLATPIVIAQLGVVMMGVSDDIIVGKLLGKTALGAAGIALSIAFLIASVFVGGISAVAPLVSKAQAEQNPAEIKHLFVASTWSALIFSVLLGLIGYITVQYFEIFEQTPAITAMAKPFLGIIVISHIPLFLFVAFKQVSDGLGHTRVAMLVTIAGIVFNIVFNYVLILGKFGFPALGVNGAAYSTLITRALMALILYNYLLKNHRFDAIFKQVIHFERVKTLVIQISKLMFGGLQFAFEVAAFSFGIIMMGWLGEDQLAAHQIVINLASLTYMMASGLGFGSGIRVGEGRGLKDVHKIRVSGNVAFLLVTLFMSACMLIMIVFKEPLVTLYISDPDVLLIATQLIIVAAIFQVSDGVQVVAAGILRGLSDVNIPTIITLFAYWIVALPLGYYLGFTQKMGGVGIWLGFLAGLTASAVMLSSRFYYLLKKMKYG